jgi:Domain of unknown function (DUF4747)
MPRQRTIQICALNIAADPHSEGVYVRLLTRAADFIVNARASDYAKITRPQQSERIPRFYTGRILLWTELDIQGRWLDLSNEDELTPEARRAISIPENARPNYRTFDYVLDNEDHRVYFEARNEFGQGLGPTVARTIFSRLLSQELQGADAPEVEVTVVPDTRALERILELPGLRMLFIRVVRPNPDVSAEAVQRVLDRLDAEHAQREEITLVKTATAERLTPTDELLELAAVASENGLVRGEGRTDDGHKLEVSTSHLPQRIYVPLDAGQNFLARLLAVFRR